MTNVAYGRGIIRGFSGSYSSGLGVLLIEINGIVQQVHCENAPTVRALENSFGNVIGPNHTVRADGGHIGKEILFSTDTFGVLEDFALVTPESKKAFKKRP